MILCTICARSGSKGVPRKNMRLINGKPLISYTIEQAINSKIFENIVISTDSKKIASLAKKMGLDVWFLRPAKFSTDLSSKMTAIRHALFESEKHFKKKFNEIVDLDVSSPLRRVIDIKNAYKKFKASNANVLITGSKSKKNPYFNMIELIKSKPHVIKKLKNQPYRRQDAPTTYDMNASIYIWKKEVLLKSDKLFGAKTTFFQMSEERSIDIDNPLDFEIVEHLLKKNKRKI